MHISKLSSEWKSPGKPMHLIPAFIADWLLSSVSSIAIQSEASIFRCSKVTLYISGLGFSYLTKDLFPIKSKSSFVIWSDKLSKIASTLLIVVDVDKDSLILFFCRNL